MFFSEARVNPFPPQTLCPNYTVWSVQSKEGEVRERRGAAVGPVAEMMPLGEKSVAPREATALVPMVEGTT